jgi:long-chain fatty acid transport protein
MIGRADDPSAVAYNPAGITQLPGVQVMGGFSMLIPSVEVDVDSPGLAGGPESGSSHSKSLGLDGLAPHAYLTWQMNDNIWFGLGGYTRFGLASEFDSNWVGRYAEYYAGVVTYSINPNIAYKINDQWSIAAGVEAMYVDVEIKRKYDLQHIPGMGPGTPDGDADLAGDCWAPGYNLAIHYKPTNWLSAGMTYRGEVHPHIEGNVDLSDNLALLGMNDQGAVGYINLPASWALGLAFQITEKLNLEIDGIYTMWSSYKNLTIEYDDLQTSKDAKNWKDVWRFQLGIEYAYNDWLDLRCGYVYDESPINDAYYDYMVPMTDRHIFSVGTGMHWDNWTLDLSYGYLMSKKKDVEVTIKNLGGVTYEQEASFKDAHCHMLGVTLGYAF